LSSVRSNQATLNSAAPDREIDPADLRQVCCWREAEVEVDDVGESMEMPIKAPAVGASHDLVAEGPSPAEPANRAAPCTVLTIEQHLIGGGHGPILSPKHGGAQELPIVPSSVENCGIVAGHVEAFPQGCR
jgi:hypothetical protein